LLGVSHELRIHGRVDNVVGTILVLVVEFLDVEVNCRGRRSRWWRRRWRRSIVAAPALLIMAKLVATAEVVRCPGLRRG
jgi:hypothetical protein